MPLRWAVSSVNLLIATAGWWQLLFTVAVRSGWSFQTLLWSSPLAVFAGVATVRWLERGGGEPVESTPTEHTEPSSGMWVTAGLVVVAVVAWRYGVLPWSMVLPFAVVHLLWMSRGPVGAPVDHTATGVDRLAWLVGGAIGSLASLALNRHEGDDGYYLAQVVGNLEHPRLALLSFDVMHGDIGLPVQQVAHRAQGYETLVSVLSALSGVGAHDVYYVVLPAVFGALAAPAFWLLARALLGRRVAAATALLAVAVMLLWAGHYYAVGNFTFVRMFQGKGVLTSVFVPLLIWRAVEYGASARPASAVQLALAGSAVAMCSSTGMIVAPLATGLVVLAGLRPTARGLAEAGGGLLSTAPVLAMLVLVKLDADGRGGTPGFTGVMSGFVEVLGDGGRVGLAVCAMLLLPLALRVSGRPSALVSRYVIAVVVVLMNGWTTVFLGQHLGRLFSWRVFWAVPFPLFVAGFFAVLGLIAIEAPTLRRRVAALAVLLGLSNQFTASGLVTWDAANGTAVEFARHKLPAKRRGIGKAVLRHSTPEDLALMPEGDTILTTIYANAPRFVAVRKIYLQHLVHSIGEQEYRERLWLMSFVSGLDKRHNLAQFIEAIDRRCVTVIVTNRGVKRVRPALPRALRAAGFESKPVGLEVPQGYALWVRSAEECP